MISGKIAPFSRKGPVLLVGMSKHLSGRVDSVKRHHYYNTTYFHSAADIFVKKNGYSFNTL